MKRIVGLVFLVASAPNAWAQTPDLTGAFFSPSTLGEEVGSAEHIFVLEVAGADRPRGLVTFRKVEDLKGRYPAKTIPHQLDQLPSRTRRDVLRWARPGQRAVCFVRDGKAKTCLGNFWWYCSADSDGSPCQPQEELDRYPLAYVGPADRLREHVRAILKGREVVITARVPVPDIVSPTPLERDWLRGKKGPVWRIKAGPKIDQHPDPYEDGGPHFVGWGVGGPEVVPALARRLKHPDPLARAEAAVDLGELGRSARKARPALRSALGDADAHGRVYAAEALLRVDPADTEALPVLVRLLKHEDAEVRTAAAGALAGLGKAGSRALPALAAALRDDREAPVRRVAAFALGEVGAEVSGSSLGRAVTALARTLRCEPDPGARRWAARALLRLGPDARPALPALAAALRDTDAEVAGHSAEALGRFGPAALPAFRDALRRPAADVVLITGQVREMGPAARSLAPALLPRLKAKSPQLRYVVARALLAIDPEGVGQKGVPVLIKLATEKWEVERPRLWLDAIETLGRYAPHTKAAVPALTGLLKHERSDVRREAAGGLGRMGPAARRAVPVLTVAALEDEKVDVRRESAQALVKVADTPAAVNVLLRMLEVRQGAMRGEAAALLGEIGPAARAAAPALRRIVRAKGSPYRAESALALWRVERPVRGADMVTDPRQEGLAALVELLDDSDGLVRAQAAEALGRIGPEARPAGPALIRALRDEDPGVREGAVVALGRLGTGAGVAAALAGALADRDIRVRLRAAVALLRLRGEDRRALRVLPREAGRPSPVLWYLPEVAEELGELGPRAKPLAPLLVRELRRDEHWRYWVAARLLKRIDPAAARKAGVP